jgi:hypothetical protein
MIRAKRVRMRRTVAKMWILRVLESDLPIAKKYIKLYRYFTYMIDPVRTPMDPRNIKDALVALKHFYGDQGTHDFWKSLHEGGDLNNTVEFLQFLEEVTKKV